MAADAEEPIFFPYGMGRKEMPVLLFTLNKFFAYEIRDLKRTAALLFQFPAAVSGNPCGRQLVFYVMFTDA